MKAIPKTKRARLLWALSLVLAGAAIGNRIDAIVRGSALLPNVVWVAIDALMIAGLLVVGLRE